MFYCFIVDYFIRNYACAVVKSHYIFFLFFSNIVYGTLVGNMKFVIHFLLKYSNKKI
jgi:hypothetical protein